MTQATGRLKGGGLLRPRGLGLAVALFAFVLVAGTAGYMAIEGWSAWDAFYMTVTTVTTVGFREVHPLTRGGQVFTACLILGGVGTVFYAVTLVAAMIVEGELQHRFDRRRRMRMIQGLNDHFILCGSGRIGSTIAATLRREGVPFVVVERDGERLQTVLGRGDLAVQADASREEVLKQVGIDRARGLIAAVGTDAENVYTVLTARGLRPDLFIVARAEAEDARRKLMRAGANRVISPYEIGAMQLAQTALRPAVVDFVSLATSSENLDLAMEQIVIGPSADFANQSLVEANLRQRYGVIVVGIRHADGQMEFNPASDAVMRAGDQLVVLGRPEGLKQLEADAG
jgi:voltage-gated potassium channel